MRPDARRAAIVGVSLLVVACGLGVDWPRYTNGVASPVGDGASDAVGAGDASSDSWLSFCSARGDAAFCSEFKKPLAEEWDVATKGSGDIDLTPNRFTSSPTAVRSYAGSGLRTACEMKGFSIAAGILSMQ